MRREMVEWSLRSCLSLSPDSPGGKGTMSTCPPKSGMARYDTRSPSRRAAMPGATAAGVEGDRERTAGVVEAPPPPVAVRVSPKSTTPAPMSYPAYHSGSWRRQWAEPGRMSQEASRLQSRLARVATRENGWMRGNGMERTGGGPARFPSLSFLNSYSACCHRRVCPTRPGPGCRNSKSPGRPGWVRRRPGQPPTRRSGWRRPLHPRTTGSESPGPCG